MISYKKKKFAKTNQFFWHLANILAVIMYDSNIYVSILPTLREFLLQFVMLKFFDGMFG